MKHQLHHEMITLAYRAEEMTPRAASAFARLERGEGSNEDMIEASKHFRQMGEEQAARHVRGFVLRSVLANCFFVVMILASACQTVEQEEAEPECDPAECADDCREMDYAIGFCLAGHESDLSCWCVDPTPGEKTCIEDDQGCQDGSIFECISGEWTKRPDNCDHTRQWCIEYLAPSDDGAPAARAQCISRSQDEKTDNTSD